MKYESITFVFFFSVLETLMRCILDQRVPCYLLSRSWSRWLPVVLIRLTDGPALMFAQEALKVPARVKDLIVILLYLLSICMPHIISSASGFPGNRIETYRIIKA